jgi:chloramphenicol O-acetyltransferase type A
MRHIDVETWSRREHFRRFIAYDYPHGGLCANVDLTAFYPVVKQSGISFTASIVYVIARAANDIPEFRHRIRSGGVVEHEIVHPATTVLTVEDLFSFCAIEYSEEFSVFVARAAERMAYVKKHPTLQSEPGKDDELYMTAVPWVSFTSVTHAIHWSPVDSVPRIAWGKFFEEGQLLKMPLSVHAHHALVDGIHIGRFYEKVQDYLDHPGFILGNA